MPGGFTATMLITCLAVLLLAVLLLADHPLLHHPKVIVTPHIGSRTFESVPRQAMKSLTNLINALSGQGETNCANGVI